MAKAKLEATQSELNAMRGRPKNSAIASQVEDKEEKHQGLQTLLDRLCIKDEEERQSDDEHEGKKHKKKNKSGLYKKASDDVKVAVMASSELVFRI